MYNNFKYLNLNALNLSKYLSNDLHIITHNEGMLFYSNYEIRFHDLVFDMLKLYKVAKCHS